MMKVFSILIAGFFAMAVPAFAANYVEPDDFKQWLQSGKKMVIIDIQPAPEFEKHHFMGSIETNAFPGKSDEEKKRLEKALPLVTSSKDDVVVVCPRGKGGAKNAYDFLKLAGVSEERLYILEDGVAEWPYPELFETGR